MKIQDQTEIVAFLADAGTHGIEGKVEIIETHISQIFLAGDRAFKLKRAVKLPYVDFSTPELRALNCQRAVTFNAPGAPGIYLGIRRIMRTPTGKLAFDSEGTAVDAVIEMKRFDQAALADRMAMAGRLTPQLMTAMARMVIALHAAAPVVHAGSGAANINAVLDINEAGFATSHLFSSQDVRKLTQRFRNVLKTHTERLNSRERDGRIRRCHGDLHLRNVCILEGMPYPFDCIEFNDQIATVDVLYDLAFLLMDLWHRGFRHYANLVANRYLDESDNEDGFVLLPFFMAVRAAVRAHVTATQAENGGAGARSLGAEARSYFSLAQDLLYERPPRLIAVGGLSGSGKSTIAEAIAPLLGMPPGARIVESDRIVTLTGHVPTYSQKVTAEAVVRKVRGVKGIAEEIEVRPEGTNRTADDEIARRAINTIEWNTVVPNGAVQATVQHGRVTLRGKLEWQYQRAAAAEAVKSLHGVHGITNLIEVAPRAFSGDVKKRIEAALKRDAELEAKGISVNVLDGKVVLEGKVHSWSERYKVENAAWSAPGVKSVVDHLQVG